MSVFSEPLTAMTWKIETLAVPVGALKLKLACFQAELAGTVPSQR